MAGFIALVSSLQDQPAARRSRAAHQQEFTSVRRIARLFWGKRKIQGAPSLRGNQMNFGSATTRGTAEGLRACFFKAPVPSGGTLTIVPSKRYRLEFDQHNLFLLQAGEDPVQHPPLAPAVHARINSMPIPQGFWQTRPFAAMLGHIQNNIEHL